MWCTECRQDVPGIASKGDASRILCARCGMSISRSDRPGDQLESGMVRGSMLESEIDLDDRELREDLDKAQRLITKYHPHAKRGNDDRSISSSQSAPDITHWYVHPPHGKKTAQRVSEVSQEQSRSWLSWTFLCLGLMTFVCGSILSAVSFVSGQGELWNIGLPLVLAGQAGLLLGLILQIDGLSSTNKRTTRALDVLDNRLADLKQTTNVISASQSPTARTFYAHMADGASTQLLLADLKGQIDMLAMKMSQEKR